MKKNQSDLAIVIPTLNEEKFIGKLLDSIADQTVQPTEVVVVDANSKDKTISEIKKRQKSLPLKYYQIPKYTISRQRNLGASKTKSQHILFLDADVVLKDPQTLEKYLAEIKIRKPDVATATFLPLSGYWKNKVLFLATDLSFRLAKPVWPMAMGINIYMNRKTFEKVGGFDDSLKFAEDHELVQRAVKMGAKFLFLNLPKVYTSTRRVEHEGRIRYTSKMIMSLIYILSKGYHKNPTHKSYKFGNFK